MQSPTVDPEPSSASKSCQNALAHSDPSFSNNGSCLFGILRFLAQKSHPFLHREKLTRIFGLKTEGGQPPVYVAIFRRGVAPSIFTPGTPLPHLATRTLRIYLRSR